ncbi:hypothetical protein ACI3ET_13325 [Ornithinimicrobium sp. LYQ121]|uniref:hypothetical protein n=1 Tax=Ornithinimicrobium sp. LYQ121 TaxID=3378801 RepID=UPI0038539BEE
MSGTDPAGPRVLHTALMSVFEPGIYQQMAWEAEAAAAEGLPWDSRIFTSLQRPDPAQIMVPWRPSRERAQRKSLQWIGLRRAYYAWLRRQAVDYDVLLLRHHAYDPFAAANMRRVACTVGSVHHTLDVPELRTQRNAVKGLALAGAEAHLGRRNIQAADLLVAVAPEIAAYENARLRTPKPTFLYPNGALVDTEPVDRRGGVPELLFASGSFRPWHGLDLLLESLASSDADFTLHVAGQVDPAMSSGWSDPRVVFHGPLSEGALQELSARAWIGISSLALHRYGMAGSPLKVRGYLAQGLPVYGGHPDVFPATSQVYRVGEPDVSQMLEFAHQMRAVARETVRGEAARYIDKRILVRDLYTSLSTFARETAQLK